MNDRLAFGKLSFWIGRGLTWAGRFLQPMNTVILLTIAAEKEPLIMLVVPVAAIAGITFLLLDNKHVLRQESEYQFTKSPLGMEMLENTRVMRKLVEEMHDAQKRQDSI